MVLDRIRRRIEEGRRRRREAERKLLASGVPRSARQEASRLAEALAQRLGLPPEWQRLAGRLASIMAGDTIVRNAAAAGAYVAARLYGAPASVAEVAGVAGACQRCVFKVVKRLLSKIDVVVVLDGG